MKAKKIPLLKLICERYPQSTNEELFSKILAGCVRVQNETVRDSKRLVSPDAEVTLDLSRHFVSRGGEKLDHAIGIWKIEVAGRTFIDCGASTGGFTDCLLYYGAMKVYAVDVGYNQLAYKLRVDPRVIVYEKQNIMDCSAGMFDCVPDAAVCDLSFRSVKRASSHILGLVKPDGFVIALIKPQFEWKEPEMGFHGVVPDEKVSAIAAGVVRDLGDEGVCVREVIVSPIRGRDGNMELLFKLNRDSKPDEKTALSKLEFALSNANV
jgi:23S rRNA (cytidine1920-2'-O)/16S rRNA (cytidine1409-2'-O)-methyltransferase